VVTCAALQMLRPRPVITKRPFLPPAIVSVNSRRASGIVENVVTRALPALTDVFARRSRAICPRSGTSSDGRVWIRLPWLKRIPWTRYTLPVRGLDSSGVIADALPTIVEAGQPTAPPWTASATS